MSRTYRFKHDKWRIDDDHVLIESHWDRSLWRTVRRPIDPHSDLAKKRLAEFHSDKMKYSMRWNGPSWFMNFHAQRPYRRRAKRELYKYMNYDDYEVMILPKPKRPWYY